MTGPVDSNANVVELFRRAAAVRGGAPAIVGSDGQVHWSFAELAEVAAGLAGRLGALGVRPGVRVLVLEPEPRRRYAAVAGVLWAGGSLVVPPGSLPPWQALTLAASAAPDAVVSGPALRPIVAVHPALRRIALRVTTTGPRLPGAVALDQVGAAPIDPVHVPDDALAVASFTTGSTGRPKIVLRGHAVLRAQHAALEHVRGLSPEDRDLVGLPLVVLHNLGAGVTSILPPANARSSSYGASVRETIALTRPTSAVGFPCLFEAAAETRTTAGTRDAMSRLRVIHLGGARVTGELLESLRALAPTARVDVVYGSTEVEPIAAIDSEAYLEALGSDPAAGICVGRPVGGLELRIDPVPAPGLEHSGRRVGSLCVRGGHAAADAGSDGWVALGDLGRTDAEGRLWILGRVAYAVGGLAPYAAELAVERLPGVRRAAMVRLDDGPGPRATVFVEPAPGATVSRRDCVRAVVDLVAEPRSAVAVLSVGRLPIVPGPSGKVDASRLVRQASRGRWLRARGARSPALGPTRPSPSGHR